MELPLRTFFAASLSESIFTPYDKALELRKWSWAAPPPANDSKTQKHWVGDPD